MLQGRGVAVGGGDEHFGAASDQRLDQPRFEPGRNWNIQNQHRQARERGMRGGIRERGQGYFQNSRPIDHTGFHELDLESLENAGEFRLERPQAIRTHRREPELGEGGGDRPREPWQLSNVLVAPEGMRFAKRLQDASHHALDRHRSDRSEAGPRQRG